MRVRSRQIIHRPTCTFAASCSTVDSLLLLDWNAGTLALTATMVTALCGSDCCSQDPHRPAGESALLDTEWPVLLRYSITSAKSPQLHVQGIQDTSHRAEVGQVRWATIAPQAGSLQAVDPENTSDKSHPH
ncbi:hypothetical protein F5884DRAFT_894045 [Xylogone sp. PMI_703]|nr:hypothetical protein F5884DRAFT_894045 [Xylogone sp. PMI_703]